MIQRIVVDILTGSRLRIEQRAYRNEEGEILVLDLTEEPPEGYEEFDPEAEQQE